MENNLPPSQACAYSAALEKLLMRTSTPKLGLTRMNALLDAIGFDRGSMRVVQVVGTNGKGSTVAFIEAILRAQGISCGLFTSPHLCTARERIRINGEIISKKVFVDTAEYVLSIAARFDDEPSFFECMLAICMVSMHKCGVKVAILEAGLGGRLDASTAVKADVLGITSIDFDHQNILGSTLTEIAREKAAAASTGTLMITVAQKDEAMKALEAYAQQHACDLRRASPTDMSLGLYGDHQRSNAGLAIALVQALDEKVSMDAVGEGLLNVQWPGRFECAQIENTHVVFDGAHNPAGLTALIAALKSHQDFRDRPLVLVYGSLVGPNVHDKIAVIKNCELAIARIYMHEPNNTRAVNGDDLARAFVDGGIDKNSVRPFVDMPTVWQEARALGAAVVITGSLYTVGEIRSEVFHIEMDRQAPSF